MRGRCAGRDLNSRPCGSRFRVNVEQGVYTATAIDDVAPQRGEEDIVAIATLQVVGVLCRSSQILAKPINVSVPPVEALPRLTTCPLVKKTIVTDARLQCR